MSAARYFVILFAYSLLTRTQGEVLSDSEQKELLDWKAPDWLRDAVPYYLSGHDLEGSPVFILDLGKWEIRSVLEKGTEAAGLLDKFVHQMMVRMKRAGNEAPGRPGSLVIVDCNDFSARQVAHVGVIPFFLQTFAMFEEYARTPGIKRVIGINVNYVVQQIYNIGKPALGFASQLFELYGTNKAAWLPVLLKDIDPKEIPQLYGGSKDHLPLAVYG